jgi:hypothetical protein
MNPKKQKEKDRRRARRLAEQAWEAADAGNLDLAEKIVRRAVAAQPDNPVVWTDQGVLLGLRHKDAEAAESFRAALSLAPNFAEAYAYLAALRLRQGFVNEALALQTKAVEHAPQNSTYVEQLEAYQAMAGQTKPRAATTNEPPAVGQNHQRAGALAQRLSAQDWPVLAEQFTRDGCVLINELVDASSCAHLRDMFDDDSLFAKTVVMDRPEFGLGAYRYFQAPIPDLVDGLRRAVYPHVARIANHWQELLEDAERYPEDWASFQEQCRQAGQTKSTPILLKYGAGGFNGLHRDLRGTVFFPIQLAVIVSPRIDEAMDPLASDPHGFHGGEFLFCDVPEGKKSRRRTISAGLGDAGLFCTRDRLIEVGGVYGLQPVKHGVATIVAGERFVLGVPFHEYR